MPSLDEAEEHERHPQDEDLQPDRARVGVDELRQEGEEEERRLRVQDLDGCAAREPAARSTSSACGSSPTRPSSVRIPRTRAGGAGVLDGVVGPRRRDEQRREPDRGRSDVHERSEVHAEGRDQPCPPAALDALRDDVEHGWAGHGEQRECGNDEQAVQRGIGHRRFVADRRREPGRTERCEADSTCATIPPIRRQASTQPQCKLARPQPEDPLELNTVAAGGQAKHIVMEKQIYECSKSNGGQQVRDVQTFIEIYQEVDAYGVSPVATRVTATMCVKDLDVGSVTCSQRSVPLGGALEAARRLQPERRSAWRPVQMDGKGVGDWFKTLTVEKEVLFCPNEGVSDLYLFTELSRTTRRREPRRRSRSAGSSASSTRATGLPSTGAIASRRADRPSGRPGADRRAGPPASHEQAVPRGIRHCRSVADAIDRRVNVVPESRRAVGDAAIPGIRRGERWSQARGRASHRPSDT